MTPMVLRYTFDRGAEKAGILQSQDVRWKYPMRPCAKKTITKVQRSVFGCGLYIFLCVGTCHSSQPSPNQVSSQEGCEELKANQKELIRQNSSLKDEITALRAQASITSLSGMNGEPSTPSSTSTPASTKADRKDPLLCICISAAQTSDLMDYGRSLTRYLLMKEVKARITDTLQKNTPTEEVKIIRVGTIKTGYIICFWDEAFKDTASVNEGWLRNLGNQTKLVRPRFGVVVHRTPTHEVDTEDKPQSMKKITEENELAKKGYKVEEIAWLKKRESTLCASASLGIWFDSAEAAEWAVNNGMVFGHRYIGSIEAYQIKKKRCHRCLTFGHLAWNCKERLRCGFCTREHNTANCPRESTPKCADCAQRHPTGATECKSRANITSLQC
ncbi:hypothetical protein ACJ73_05157 [Blastomyces percursus]|uniref:CCHC-type domain-containing protein n=1 Tax=Blastomyces percursus TaxID=1658174 RepID=A0A1J9QTD2_9EURO|nr:hypothetical protein ACJ73_05157 [Blastomyces percursus]